MVQSKKLFLAPVLICAAGTAQAEFQICNDTRDLQYISIGYKFNDEWISRGWWDIAPGGCASPIEEALVERYYYLRVEKEAGVFKGDGYTFCVSRDRYSISGDTECEDRGYETLDFIEVDAGQGATRFTYRLEQQAMDLAQVRSDTSDGLEFCNQTSVTQSVSVGYEGAEGWTSEGWWNIEPNECALVISEALNREFYYYRAEVEQGPFDGQNYTFCTSTDAFTIVGDTQCEARGYTTEDFAEIYVGANTTGHRFNITAETGGRHDTTAPDDPPEDEVAADDPPAVQGEVIEAGFEFCNETAHVQAISIGYNGTEGWTSEGWWNIEPDECVAPITAALTGSYYYYRAEVNAGGFGPGSYPFCTTSEAYVIVGDSDCEARGYVTEDFAEVFVGETPTGYRMRLTSLNSGNVDEETPAGGLRFCNETDEAQSIAIGYEADDGWTSSGWWNLEPGDCATPLKGPLTKRFYYYRAEVSSGPFEGGGPTFCTTEEAFDIIGDQNCAARGYDEEAFREIDIGESKTTHLVRLVGPGGPDGTTPGVLTETGANEVALERGDSETGGVTPPENTPETTPETVPEPANAGFEVCNETSERKSVAFGYEGAEGWTSEGWWVVEPATCVTPELDGQRHRFVYYRAVGDDNMFAGESYFFCTEEEAFTIVGDSDCEARGYDREDFREFALGDAVLARLDLLADPADSVTEAPEVVTPDPEVVLPEPEPEPEAADEPGPDTDPVPEVVMPEPEAVPEPEAPANPRRTGSRG